MTVVSRTATLACAAVLTFASEVPQAPQVAPAVEQPSVVFSTTARLVHVNVVVEDKQGRPIADLRKEDFEVLDNGVPQSIAFFTAEHAINPGRRAAAESVFTNQLPVATGWRSGYSAILLDWLNTPWGDKVYARSQALRMLTSVGVHDQVALYVLGNGLRVVQEFTADTVALAQKIAAEQGQVVNAPDPEVNPLTDASVGFLPFPDFGPSGYSATRREDHFLTERRVTDTLKAFEMIAAHLAAIPGRKSLIWVSAGFPQSIGFDIPPAGKRPEGFADARTFSPELNRALSRLNEADVSVYPVDARGLSPNPGVWKNISTMQELAGRTGGKAYYNRNDLAQAMRSALDDVRVSYTLAYYLPAAATRRDTLHHIRIRVHRPGVTVRHRSEYLERADGATVAPAEAKSEVRQAWSNPLDSTALGINAEAVRSGNTLVIQIALEANAISLTRKDGRLVGKLSIVAGFRKDDGTPLGIADSKSLALALREHTYQKVLQEGLKAMVRLPVPGNAASVRLLVRDTATNKVGTLTIPLQAIPKRGGD
ncbi:MAG: VWA domain-containing protein [Bryobacterales bacterium]|nr:VWA domain-containing protein [Bryobacterales bacterium]